METNTSNTDDFNSDVKGFEDNQSGQMEVRPSPAKKTKVAKEDTLMTLASEHKWCAQALQKCVESQVQAYFAAGESDAVNNLWAYIVSVLSGKPSVLWQHIL